MRRPMAEVNHSPRAAGTQNHITKVREAAVAVRYSSSSAAVCVCVCGGGGESFLLNVTIPLLLLITYTAVSSYVFVRGIAL